jgi:hypothetical protein
MRTYTYRWGRLIWQGAGSRPEPTATSGVGIVLFDLFLGARRFLARDRQAWLDGRLWRLPSFFLDGWLDELELDLNLGFGDRTSVYPLSLIIFTTPLTIILRIDSE